MQSSQKLQCTSKAAPTSLRSRGWKVLERAQCMQVCAIDLYMQGSEGRVVNQSPDSAFPSVAAEQSRRLHLHSEARAPFQRLSSSSTQWRTARRWERMTTRATKPLVSSYFMNYCVILIIFYFRHIHLAVPALWACLLSLFPKVVSCAPF